MKIKFNVLGVSETTFTSTKSGRTYNRSRLIGMAVDAYDQTQQPAVADLAFDASAQSIKQGETYLLDVVKLELKNAMLALDFKSAEAFKSSRG